MTSSPDRLDDQPAFPCDPDGRTSICLLPTWSGDGTVAAHGVRKLYELSYAQVEYLPLYPALLSVSAFMERWLHIAGTHTRAPIVFKLPPQLALLMLPSVAGAAIDVACSALAGRYRGATKGGCRDRGRRCIGVDDPSDDSAR